MAHAHRAGKFKHPRKSGQHQLPHAARLAIAVAPLQDAIAADTDLEAEILSTSLYQMFGNLVLNNRKPLQPPVDSLSNLMNSLSEEARFQVNQMTACTFAGSKQTLAAELKEFIRYSRVDELMICSPIFDHQDKMKSLRLLKEVMESLNQDQ